MSFIKPDDTWVLWAFLIGWAAMSIYLEQKYKWASKVTGAIIALLGALVLANLNVIPTESPVYDNVWGYVVPLAVPLLLFKADIRKIWKESGRTFGAFHISALGTMLGTTIGVVLLRFLIPEPVKVGAMITGSYIGGGVNFVAMADAFKASEDVINATIVADNLNMALYFFILMAIPGMLFFKKNYNHPYEDQLANSDGNENKAASYWGRKEISLLDIAKAMGSAVVIVAASVKIAAFFGGIGLPGMLSSILGQKYFIITTLTVILASLFPKFFSEIKGAEEIGTFFIYIFFVVIGTPASISAIITKSPMLLVFCAIAVIINLIVTLALGKLFKFNLEELLIASNANIGGPTTAAAMAIAKGWNGLVLPAMLVGVWGYVIGNYLALFLGNSIFKMIVG